MENYLELVPALAPLIDNFKKKAKSNLRTKDIQNGMLRTLVDPSFRVLVLSNESPISYGIVQVTENLPWHPRTVHILQGYCTPGYPEVTDMGMKEIERWAKEIQATRLVAETKRSQDLHGFNKRLGLAPMTVCIVKELTGE